MFSSKFHNLKFNNNLMAGLKPLIAVIITDLDLLLRDLDLLLDLDLVLVLLLLRSL